MFVTIWFLQPVAYIELAKTEADSKELIRRTGTQCSGVY